MNMVFERKLAIPQEVKQMYPASAEIQTAVKERTEELKNIVAGRGKRLRTKYLLFREFIRISHAQQATATRGCFISLTPTENPICLKA